MGIGKRFSGGGSHYTMSPGCAPKLVREGTYSYTEVTKPDPRNPDPYHFKIEKAQKSKNDKFILAQVHYPNCTNFKGMKLMIINMSSMQLLTAKKLDPHFFEEGSDANIVARFRPTAAGWEMGVAMLNMLDK